MGRIPEYINSLINVQLYGTRQISSFYRPEDPETVHEDRDPQSKSAHSRSYTASELVELLDELKVPYLSQSGSTLEAPSSLIGCGGNAQVKYHEVQSRYSDIDFRQRGAAIKEFGWRSSTKAEKMNKVEDIEKISSSTITQAYIEICIMKHPRLSTHSNILQLLGTADYNSAFVQSSGWSELCLVTEYADLGSLDSYISKHSLNIEWSFKCQLIYDIAAGLQAIHDCDIVHNDIKCDNILLFSATQSTDRIIPKISDFGWSIPLATTYNVNRTGGTALYAAPETFSKDAIVHPSRDVYSFGLVIMQIVTEERPFIGEIAEDEVLDFKKGPEFVNYVKDCISASAPTRSGHLTTLVVETLHLDPQKRLSDLTLVNKLLPESFRSKTVESCLDPSWLLDRLSPRESPTTSELFEKLRLTYSRKASGQLGLQEQLYTESVYRASNQYSPRVALDLALLYGYGIGTNASWPDCELWIRSAALLGSEAALLFLKRLNPKIQSIANTAEFQDDNICQLLIQYCRRLFDQKSPDSAAEVGEIADLLFRTEPDLYEANHASLFGCPCATVSASANARATLLSQLWAHCRRAEHTLPPDLAQLVTKNASVLDSDGKTLLHDLAVTRHPPFPEDSTDIILHIGELLLNNHCPPDAVFEDSAGGLHTAMSLAIDSRNISIAALLSEKLETIEVDVERVVKIALRHDHEMLDIIFSPNDSVPLSENKREGFRRALRYAATVPIAERKLRHGAEYIDRGQKSMDILYQYNFKHKVMVGYPFRDLVLGGLVSAGNDDLVKHFFTNRILPLPADALRPQILNRYLINSIYWGHRDLFTLFLRLGADTNQICPNALIETAWGAAAVAIKRDYFYFDRLLVRGADWRKLKEMGSETLTLLIMDPRGANAVNKILMKYPQLLEFDLPWAWSEREKEHSVRPLNLAVRLGFPVTVTAVLEACAAAPHLSGYRLAAIVYSSGQRPECLQNLEILISHGRDILSPERILFYLGYTLVIACKDGNAKAVKKLLELGADPNFFNSGNSIRLSPIVAALIRRRLFAENIDSKMTAQAWFEEMKFNDVRNLLLDAGLDEDRCFGAKNETAEVFVRGIKNLK